MKTWFQKDPAKSPAKMAVGASNASALYRGGSKVWPDASNANKHVYEVVIEYVEGQDPLAYQKMLYVDKITGGHVVNKTGPEHKLAERYTYVHENYFYFQNGNKKYSGAAAGNSIGFANTKKKVGDLRRISRSDLHVLEYDNPDWSVDLNDRGASKTFTYHEFQWSRYFANQKKRFRYKLRFDVSDEPHPLASEWVIGQRVKLNAEVPPGVIYCEITEEVTYPWAPLWPYHELTPDPRQEDFVTYSFGVHTRGYAGLWKSMPSKEKFLCLIPCLKGMTVSVTTYYSKAKGSCSVYTFPEKGGTKLCSFALDCAPSPTYNVLGLKKFDYCKKLDSASNDAFWKWAYGVILDITDNTPTVKEYGGNGKNTDFEVYFKYKDTIKISYDFEVVDVTYREDIGK